MSLRSHARYGAWLAAAALLTLGCGGEEGLVLSSRPGAVRLDFHPAANAPAAGERRVVTRYDVLGTRPDWVVRAARSALVELPAEGGAEGLNALELAGGVGPDKALEVLIPGRFDPREVNRVSVSLVVPGRRVLSASLYRGGRVVVPGYAVSVTGGQGLQTVELDLSLADEVETCDHVALRIEGEGGPVQFTSLELVQEPGVGALPPLEAPALVDLSGQWMRVFGLSSRRALDCKFRVREGASLSFDYGLPRRIQVPGSSSFLRVVLTGSSGKSHQYNYSFEHEQVIVYTEKNAVIDSRRSAQDKLKKIKNPEAKKMRRKRLAKGRKALAPAGAFGEAQDEAEEEDAVEDRVRVADIPTGLVEGWLRARIPLDEFAGEEVVARLELIEEAVPESVCAIGRPRLVVTDPKAPLILLVTSDSHRADHFVGAAPGAATDNSWLDQVAERGAVFTNCWAPANGMQASHAALMTGLSPRDTGLLRDGQEVGERVETLAERFREAGWTTVASLSHGALAPEVSNLGQGFEIVSVPRVNERNAERAVEHLLDALTRTQGVPVFAWLHLHDADAPYDPPSAFRRLHYPEDADPYDPTLPAPDRRPEWDAAVRDLGYVDSLYAAQLTWMDRQMRPLVEHPRVARGLFAFAGSHGESLHTFGHGSLTPEVLHVPLLLAGPGIPEGVRVPLPVRLVDVGRTLLDLAGLDESPFPGATILDRDRGPGPRFALASDGSFASVESDGLMLVLSLAPGEGHHSHALYDIDEDPVGSTDLSAERVDEALDLRHTLIEWLESAPTSAAAPTGELREERVEEWMTTLGVDIERARETTTDWIDPDCVCARCTVAGEAPE